MKRIALLIAFVLLMAVLINELHLQSIEKDSLKTTIELRRLEVRYLTLQLEIIDESAILESKSSRP